MGKSVLWFLAVIVIGALLGAFLGKFLGMVIPAGSIRDLFATNINAGLAPTRLDLQVIELTFGCMLKFNITSVLGIVFAALLFNKIGGGK
jgi:hypothetical protein